MLFLFAIHIFASLNDLDSVQSELYYMIDRISDELDSLAEIKTKLSLMNPEKLKTKIKSNKIEEEEKSFMLAYVNTSKADEMQNFNSVKTLFIKNKEICTNISLSWLSNSVAPTFTFRSPSLTVARHILFESTPPCQCTVKQLRLEFYHNDELMFKSKVIDLQKGFSDDLTIDLETDVVFSSFNVDVIQNWGDDFQTCLNRFHVFGPKF
ncbi:hypothetical protein M9Y10_029430 [Tritrichomonas musculus]|uniref:SUN domain-containing protein n=1 Tax=Tritrichomonas musculus TaxID=1915356 RepID=A0ABR2KM50_9EUKA